MAKKLSQKKINRIKKLAAQKQGLDWKYSQKEIAKRVNVSLHSVRKYAGCDEGDFGDRNIRINPEGIEISEDNRCLFCDRYVKESDRVPVEVRHWNRRILYCAHRRCRRKMIEGRERRGENIPISVVEGERCLVMGR